MLKKFFKVIWEAGIVILFLLALAMIGSGEDSSKESGYSIFMLYGIVCYLLKRIKWLISKFRNSPKIVLTSGKVTVTLEAYIPD